MFLKISTLTLHHDHAYDQNSISINPKKLMIFWQHLVSSKCIIFGETWIFSCCFSLLLKCWKQKIICWSISPNPMWLSYLYCNILVVTPVTQLRYALLFTNVLKTKSEERPKGQQMLFTKSKYDLNISEKKTWLHWFFSRLGSKCLLWWINVAY